MRDPEKLKEFHLAYVLACRRQAEQHGQKAYLRRCNRLIKRLVRQKGVTNVLTVR